MAKDLNLGSSKTSSTMEGLFGKHVRAGIIAILFALTLFSLVLLVIFKQDLSQTVITSLVGILTGLIGYLAGDKQSK